MRRTTETGSNLLSETLKKQLEDELQIKVADEFVKRRSEIEWYAEGDFETHRAEIRKLHVWGEEHEILMCSHVLQSILRMPIEVYMKVSNSRSLKVIAKYGREYGHRTRNPIHVLYDGHGHYDTL